VNWWSERRLVKAVAAVTALCAATAVIYWSFVHRTEVYNIPCGYRQTFFVEFNDPTGVPPKRSDFWHYEYSIDSSGLVHVNGNAVEADWLYSDIRESCTPARATVLQWKYTVGTRYREGRKLFDYTCYSPADSQSAKSCESIVDSRYEERSAAWRGAPRVAP
jgi:hypothetical protein